MSLCFSQSDIQQVGLEGHDCDGARELLAREERDDFFLGAAGASYDLGHLSESEIQPAAYCSAQPQQATHMSHAAPTAKHQTPWGSSSARGR